MTSPNIEICAKLSHDEDDTVREIAKRCMREYDEFSGMRYARLTARDEASMDTAAREAHDGGDEGRAGVLDEAARMIRTERAILPPSQRAMKPRKAAGKAGKAAPAVEASAPAPAKTKGKSKSKSAKPSAAESRA